MHSLDGPVLCHAFSRATGPLPDAGPPWAPPANSAACAPRACAACLAPLRTMSATAFHRHRCQRRSSATRGSAGDAANAVGDHALAVDLRWRGGGDCQQQPAHSHHDERARVGSLGSFGTEQAGTDVDAASLSQSAVNATQPSERLRALCVLQCRLEYSRMRMAHVDGLHSPAQLRGLGHTHGFAWRR